MKTRYLFILIGLIGIILASCKEEKSSSTPTVPATPYQEGQELTYSFIVNEDTVVKMRDQVVDYGFTNFPVLMMVHKETLIKEPGWGSVFHPLLREKLDSVLVLWGQEFHMNNISALEKAHVARNFLDFVLRNDLDVGIFVDLVLEHYGNSMAPVLEVISSAEKINKSPNDYLLRMYSENIPPEIILSELKPVKQGFAIFSIYLHAIMIVETWVDFANNSGPISNAPENYMSFLCSGDTVLANYTGGTSFRSNDYKLSYDAGLWEAKCTYHLEGIYNADNSTCPGKFIPKCNTISTYVHVKGPDFIVDGKVGYSTAINAGTFDVPVADMNGKVQVTYGDCCCFRKFSILNFKINGETGYQQTTFDPGK